MGYCHTFWFKEKVKRFDEKLLVKIKVITDSFYKKEVIQFESDNDSEPIVTEKEIRFNGKGDKGYETFYLTPETVKYSFIKTGGTEPKEYDLVVCLVLLIFKLYYKDNFALNSDGFYPPIEGSWLKAIKYINKVCKKTTIRLEDVAGESNKTIRIY